MQEGSVELVSIAQVDHRGVKQGLIRTVFRPSIVPLVDICPMQFMLASLELTPLNASVEHMQDIVEDFVEGEFWRWSFLRLLQVQCDVAVEVFSGDALGETVVDEFASLSIRLRLHKHGLP